MSERTTQLLKPLKVWWEKKYGVEKILDARPWLLEEADRVNGAAERKHSKRRSKLKEGVPRWRKRLR
jgi:hypothetical protein